MFLQIQSLTPWPWPWWSNLSGSNCTSIAPKCNQFSPLGIALFSIHKCYCIALNWAALVVKSGWVELNKYLIAQLVQPSSRFHSAVWCFAEQCISSTTLFCNTQLFCHRIGADLQWKEIKGIDLVIRGIDLEVKGN